jgi:hypothetical protein
MFGKKINEIWSSISVYYKKNSGSYWDSITPCCITGPPEKLSGYYLDFSSKADYPGDLDQDGIPIYQNYYHPVVICQYALGLYELLQAGNFSDNELKKKYLKQADWLVKNVKKVNGRLTWQIEKKIRGYGLEKPWSSALAQGEAISVLLRGYLLTNNNSYVKIAEETLELFEADVNKGGIKSKFNGCVIYEEYPSLKPNFVLNGFIFALFGLYDFILLDKNPKAKLLFEEGIRTLEKLLPLFDTGYWSQYNLYYHPGIYIASYKYHLIHVEQLKALYILTGRKIFLEYSRRWNSYANSFFIKTFALIKKVTGGNIVRE